MRMRVLVASSVVAVSIAACHRPNADEHLSHMSAGDMAVPNGMPAVTQGNPALPPSFNEAPARLAASTRHGEWVKLAWEPGSSDSLMAWIVYPSTSNAKTPVVVVVHEIFGLATWVRGVADQVAADGFIAIAPDLVSRARGGPSTQELSGDSARKLIANVNTTDRNKGITAAARYGMAQPSAAARYAVMGFCWGGSTVWAHAVNGGTTGYVGGVAFYGAPYITDGAPNADSLRKITKPIVLLSGAKDARIGSAMPAIDSMMKVMGKSYVGVNYPGAAHGFVRIQNDPKTPPDEPENKANVAAIQDAWPRTLAFLRQNLK